MEVKAETKYVRISPEKANQVARLLQGKPVGEALAVLDLCPRKAAGLFKKTLNSAVANAENNFELNKDDLVVKTAAANPGFTMKRIKTKARGAAGRIQKKTSHFRIILTDEI